MAITWKNINQQNNSGALTLLQNAGKQITDGLGGLTDTLQGVASNRQRVWNSGRDANTESLYNKLASYSTPEALEAAISSGEIASFGQQFGNQIDQAALRDAPTRRINELRQGIVAAQNYGDQQVDRANEPYAQELVAAVARGDRETADRIFAERDFRNEGSLVASALGDYRTQDLQQRENDALDLQDQARVRATENDAQLRAMLGDPLNKELTNTEIMRNAETIFRGINGNTETDVQNMLDTMSRSLNRSTGISEVDQRLLDDQQLALDNEYRIGQNPFTELNGPTFVAADRAVSLVDEAAKNSPQLAEALEKGRTRTETMATLERVMSTGVPMPLDGKLENVPVPPAIASLALRSMAPGFTADSLETHIGNLMTQGSMANYYQGFLDHQVRSNELRLRRDSLMGKTAAQDTEEAPDAPIPTAFSAPQEPTDDDTRSLLESFRQFVIDRKRTN